MHMIPRFASYGNDAFYMDVIGFLGNPISSELRSYQYLYRVIVHKNCPRIVTINGLKISKAVTSILNMCDIVFVRGVRVYEMLHCSESVTGINAGKPRMGLSVTIAL